MNQLPKTMSAMVHDAPSLAPAMQAALAALCLRVLPIWSRQLATSKEQSEQAVHQMLAAFKVIEPLVAKQGASADAAPAVQASVEQMYKGLQYQDRISQMLALLQEDISSLHRLIETPDHQASALSADEWLERLESRYAMAEQRRDHAAADQSAGAPPDGETSFF